MKTLTTTLTLVLGLTLALSAQMKRASTGGAGAGASSGPTLTVPSLSDWAWVNQSTATAAVANGRLTMCEPTIAGSHNIRLLTRTAPATPYTVTALIQSHGGENYNSMGIGWRQSSDGKLVLVGSVSYNSSRGFYYSKWSNLTTEAANYVYSTDMDFGAGKTRNNPPFWLRITDNGTNRLVYTSSDGYTWDTPTVSFASVSRTDYLTANQLVLFLDAYALGNLVPPCMSVLSYVIS